MNAESFVQYVQQLSKLYQLPYEELKSLSMQYPYFQNLHLLLALKSKLEDHPDYRRNLAKASTYSVDRAQLYRTLTKLERLAVEDNFLLHEEVLELQEITKLEEKLKDLELIPDSNQERPLSNNQHIDSISNTNTIPPKEIQEVSSEDLYIPEDLPIPAIGSFKKIPEAFVADPNSTLSSAITDNGIIKDALALSLVLEDFHHQQQKVLIPVEFSDTTLDENLIANLIASSTLLEDFYQRMYPINKHQEAVTTSIESSSASNLVFIDGTLLSDAVALSFVLDHFHQKNQPLKATVPQAAPSPTKEAIPLPSPKLNFEQKTKQLKKQLKKIKGKKPKPMPKKSFSTWIEQFQSAHVKPHLSDLMEAKKKEKITLISSKSDPTKLQGDNLNFFAQKSILENKGMASETLAEILIAQMQYQKAIKVYERLSLIFPKKSAFFADRIENLKKLIS